MKKERKRENVIFRQDEDNTSLLFLFCLQNVPLFLVYIFRAHTANQNQNHRMKSNLMLNLYFTLNKNAAYGIYLFYYLFSCPNLYAIRDAQCDALPFKETEIIMNVSDDNTRKYVKN